MVDSGCSQRARRLAAVLLTLSIAAACGDAPPSTVRLVEVFEPTMVEGTAAPSGQIDPLGIWDFSAEPGTAPTSGSGSGTAATREAAENLAWEAIEGVSGLQRRDGRLVGTTTSALPVLHVALGGDPDDDQLHSVEVRMRISAGENVRALVRREFDEEARAQLLAELKGGMSTPFVSPIVAGEGFRTYVVTTEISMRASAARHLILLPTDAADATFEIEHVRLVRQKDHLASIPSGVGWQALKDIYRETIVARAPEVVRLPVRVPPDAWLDLQVGTVQPHPLTFVVRVNDGSAAERTLVGRTVTHPYRWEPMRVDLAAFAGSEITLELALGAGQQGALGFWGSPVLRQERPLSPAAVHRPSDSIAQGTPPQGVVFLVADTLRRDHLDAYGYERETAPVLRRMAANGVLFRDTVAHASWTKVSTPSIFTSLLPTSHRVADFDDQLSDAAVTMAEIFRDAGYATAAFSSVLFTGKLSNMQQGYEELHEGSSTNDDEYPAKTAREFVDRAAEWLEAHRDVPFFLFLHVFDPHDPYRPRPPHDARWADPAAAEAHEKELEAVREVIEDPLLKAFGMPSRADLERAEIDADAYVGHDVDWYDGSIRGMDTEIGRLLERLRELGLEESTLVVFTSDHGEEFLEHGRTFHGQTVYGELTQVPLIFSRPESLPGGLAIEETVRAIDVMPTVLELAHLPVPTFLQGRSLLPLVAAYRDSGARRAAGAGSPSSSPAADNGWQTLPAISEKARTEHPGAPPPRDTGAYAIVLDGWKLVHNFARPPGAPEFELFDHRLDPLDLDDIAAEHPDVVARLAAELQATLRRAEEARLPEGSSTESLSPEELARLRALGYIR